MESFREKLESLRKLQISMQEKYAKPKLMQRLGMREDGGPGGEEVAAQVPGGQGDRQNKLRKIDADLAAVEDALEQRRRSLAEIDQKLNCIQPSPAAVSTGRKSPLRSP